MAAGLDPAQGLGTPAGARRRSVGGALWRRPWLKGLTLLSPPVLAFLLVYIAALIALFVTSFWTVDVFTSQTRPPLDARQLPHALGGADLSERRAAHDRHRGRRDADRRDHRVPVRLLHGARRIAACARRPVRARAAPALGVVHRTHLFVEADPQLERRARLVAAQARPARARARVHEHRNLDRLLVRLAPVHDPAGLRRARAHPPLLHRGLTRPRRQGIAHAPVGDPAAGAAGHRRRLDLHVLADARRLHHPAPDRRRGRPVHRQRRRRLGICAAATCRSLPPTQPCPSP